MRVQVYETSFIATCPTNGLGVQYHLKITLKHMVMVEDILEEVASIETGYHEDIADRLAERFGGDQELVADHHGVKITSYRKENA